LGVFENRLLGRIFRPKREKVTGEWKKKVNNQDNHNLYSSVNITGAIKSRRITRAGYRNNHSKYFNIRWTELEF
jgi:hypothetical protein